MKITLNGSSACADTKPRRSKNCCKKATPARTVSRCNGDNCICGGRLVQLCVEFIQSKQLELKDYKPAAAEAAQDHDHSNGTQKERLLENIVQELERKNQDLLMEVDKIKLDKAYLDGKFLKSGIMEDLTKQLFDVINYSMHLKQNLDTAQKNLDMIQKKRTQELKELYDRTNEEKQKLYSQVSSLQKDLNSYKERNSELSRAQEILRNTESSKELQNSSFDAQRIIELAARVVSLEESLAKVTETSRSDHNRAYKFERELHGMKETFYKQLLDQYAQCENMAYRHSRYEKTFKKFYELNAEQQLNLKDDLDELVKYVKTREDKIARIEKEWKKVSASLNEEKKQNETFLKEMTNTTKEYEKIYKEIQQLRVENAELNSNFNKVYKEKTADKQAYDTEVQKLREELKRFKEQVPVLKTTINELKTSIADHERAFVRAAHPDQVPRQLHHPEEHPGPGDGGEEQAAARTREHKERPAGEQHEDRTHRTAHQAEDQRPGRSPERPRSSLRSPRKERTSKTA